jgi:hypothetical protein
MTKTYEFEGFSKLLVGPANEAAGVRFHLTFQSSSKTEIVKFEVPSGVAMAFLSVLQTLQRRHGWRIPHRPPPGKPHLTVVSSDDSSDEKP